MEETTSTFASISISNDFATKIEKKDKKKERKNKQGDITKYIAKLFKFGHLKGRTHHVKKYALYVHI